MITSFIGSNSERKRNVKLAVKFWELFPFLARNPLDEIFYGLGGVGHVTEAEQLLNSYNSHAFKNEEFWCFCKLQLQTDERSS
jgi:hypothetical protein